MNLTVRLATLSLKGNELLSTETVCVSWQAPTPSQTLTPRITQWLKVRII